MLYTLGSSLPIPDPCEVYLKHPENNEGLGDQSTTRIIMAILQVSINYVHPSLPNSLYQTFSERPEHITA